MAIATQLMEDYTQIRSPSLEEDHPDTVSFRSALSSCRMELWNKARVVDAGLVYQH